MAELTKTTIAADGGKEEVVEAVPLVDVTAGVDPQKEGQITTNQEDTKGTNKASNPCWIVNKVSISRWRLNASWTGAFLNLGSNYYIAAIRALLRTTRTTKAGEDIHLIGLVIESFGYWDLRSAHATTVFRDDGKGGVTQLEPFTCSYQKSTASYKLCRMYFREEEFLPKHSYSFRYNGASDYEISVFLTNLTSIDSLFADAKEIDLKDPLPPSNPEDWETLPSRVKMDRQAGSWGNPNARSAPYGPGIL